MGYTTSQKRYSAIRSLLKTVLPFVGGSGAVIGLAVLDALPTNAADIKTNWPVIVPVIAAAVMPGLQNWWKNRHK